MINLENEDQQCFKWCVTRALNPVDKNSERITELLREESKIPNWGDMEYPVKLREIDKFEKLNPRISINVFGYEGKVSPLRISKLQREITINLLLIHDERETHYCVIKNMSRLLRSQVTKHTESAVFCLR